MFRLLLLVIPFTYLFGLHGDNDHDTFIDTTHKYISETIEDISKLADDIATDTIQYTKSIGSENNETNLQTKGSSSKELNPESVDALFQNEKYIEDTKESFLRLSSDYSVNSLDNNEFNVKLSARLALNKSRKNLKLYLSGFNQDNLNDITDKKEYGEGKPEIGISYVTQFKDSIETKYSLGIRSLYPYVRTRFSYTKQTDLWLIEPVQNIEYSTKDEFKENTKLYLDTELIDRVKFRLEFGRGTSSKGSGMDYNSVASIFWTPQSRTGLQLSQGIYGNTKYQYITNEVTKEKERYEGINNYVTTLTFRQNIYRKWLFYEVSPGINFHKTHDFDPNYRLYIRLDMFFGKM